MTDTKLSTEPQATRSAASGSEQEARVGWRFLYSKRWIGYFAMLAVFSIACVMLGNWQFERRAEARAEIARIDANYDAPAVSLDEVLPSLSEFDEDAQKWRTAEIVGEYIEHPMLARNRPGPEGVGSDLIYPIRTASGQVFFVDRGWVAIDGAQAESGAVTAATLPQPAKGEVTVIVRLRASEPDIAGRESTESTVASINGTELARITGTADEAYTGAYGMLVSETPSGEHGMLPAKPERDEGPHLSYALQWYVFIIIAAIGVAYAARREYRTMNAGSESVARQDERSAARRKRRGPTDADEEDALLDG